MKLVGHNMKTVGEFTVHAGETVPFVLSDGHSHLPPPPPVEPLEALDQLVELGFKRILTSGQAPSVPQGAELIRALIEYAGDRIEILPGGGIRPHNVREIVEQTGAKQVHLSAFEQRFDSSVHNRPNITFGGALRPPEDRYDIVDRNAIRSISDLLSS